MRGPSRGRVCWSTSRCWPGNGSATGPAVWTRAWRAWAVNDALDDTARPRLARLAPALIGTALPASGRAGRWRARVNQWLLSSPCSEVFAEIELQRRVRGLADAVLAATGSQTARDTTLIGVLAEAVAAHRATHRLPPVTTTGPLAGHPGTPSAISAAPRR